MHRNLKTFILSFFILTVFLIGNIHITEAQTYLFNFSKWDAYFRIPTFTIPNGYITTRNDSAGFQFNITLTSMPMTNRVNINIERANLKLYYQPALDEELNLSDYDFVNATHALKNGSVVEYRSLNVVGSYAAYGLHEGNEYESGKIFHLYHPVLLDANGATSWATLNITNNVLSITADLNWLQNAVYPVTIDPTFGYETKGGSWSNCAANAIKTLYSLSQAGTVTTISLYVLNGKNAVRNMDVGIYTGTTRTYRETFGVPASYDNWLNCSLTTSQSLSAATYGLAMKENSGSTNHQVYYDSGDTDQTQADTGLALGANLPDPFVVDSQFARKYSIHADYTVSGTNYIVDVSQSASTTWAVVTQAAFKPIPTQSLTSTWNAITQSTFNVNPTQTLTSTWTIITQSAFKTLTSLSASTSWIVDVYLYHIPSGNQYYADLTQATSTTWAAVVKWSANALPTQALTSTWNVLTQSAWNVQPSEALTTTWTALAQTTFNVQPTWALTTSWIVEAFQGKAYYADLTLTVTSTWIAEAITSAAPPPSAGGALAMAGFAIILSMAGIGIAMLLTRRRND